MNIDLNKLTDIEISGIDTRDYPRFCDAYLSRARHPDGTDLTDEELDEINDNHRDWIHERTMEQLF